jgi:hypothetical protein
MFQFSQDRDVLKIVGHSMGETVFINRIYFPTLIFIFVAAFPINVNCNPMNKCIYPDGHLEFTDQPCPPKNLTSSKEKSIPTIGQASNSRGQSVAVLTNLNGTWILDAKATENLIVNSPLPLDADKLAKWFGLGASYMCAFTYEFRGDEAIASAYRGRQGKYRLLSRQGSEIRFTLQNATESPVDDILTVTILNDRNIKIVHSSSPEMRILLWKRGQLKTDQSTPSDVQAAVDAWLVSIQHILNFLNAAPNPARNSDVSR